MSVFTTGKKRFYVSTSAKFTVNPKEQQLPYFFMPKKGELIQVTEHYKLVRDGSEVTCTVGIFLVNQITEYLICCSRIDALMSKVSFSIADFRVGLYSYENKESIRKLEEDQELAYSQGS